MLGLLVMLHLMSVKSTFQTPWQIWVFRFVHKPDASQPRQAETGQADGIACYIITWTPFAMVQYLQQAATLGLLAMPPLKAVEIWMMLRKLI